MQWEKHFKSEGNKIQFVYDFTYLWNKDTQSNFISIGASIFRSWYEDHVSYCLSIDLLFCTLQLWVKTKSK